MIWWIPKLRVDGISTEKKRRFRWVLTSERSLGNNEAESRVVLQRCESKTNLEFMLSKVPEGGAKTNYDLHFPREQDLCCKSCRHFCVIW
jgi:hypothetical protein